MSAIDPSAPGLPLAGGGGGGGAVTLTGDTTGTGTGTIATTTSDLTIASEARGDILRRGASAWERVAAKTAGNVVAGDGTDAVSVAIATPLAVAPAANRVALGLAIQPAPSDGTVTDTGAAVGTATATAFSVAIDSGASINDGSADVIAWPSSADVSSAITVRVVCSAAGAGNRIGTLFVAFTTPGGTHTLEVIVADTGATTVKLDGGFVIGYEPVTPTTTTWLRVAITGQRVRVFCAPTAAFQSVLFDADYAWLAVSGLGSIPTTIATIKLDGRQVTAGATAAESVVFDNLSVRSLL